MGGVVGPVIPVMAFQGAGPLRCGLGMRRVMTVSGLGEFESGEVRSEAVVNAAAERKHAGPRRVMSRLSGSSYTAGRRLAAAVLTITCVPAGILTPPSSKRWPAAWHQRRWGC